MACLRFKIHFSFICLFFICHFTAFAQEICNNGIDDDGDGLIDLNDPDCVCEPISATEVVSIIPNPSFEDMTCCPTDYEQLDCATDWVQATEGTTDYWNTCGLMFDFVPLPIPDGDGFVGGYINPDNEQGFDWDWFEYVGACLETPMLAGVEYTLKFYMAAAQFEVIFTNPPILVGPIDITLFGFNMCGTMPLNINSCPASEGWYELGVVNYQPVNAWNEFTITFIPNQDTEAVMLGAPCMVDDPLYQNNGTNNSMYFMYDDLTLSEASLFTDGINGEINQEGGNCFSDLMLSFFEDDVYSYQWYYEGVALIGEVEPTMNLGSSGYDDGVYQLRVSHDQEGTCIVKETVVSSSDNNPINFEANLLSGCDPLAVDFTNNSDPELEGSVTWNFGSEMSNLNNPSIEFAVPGFYTVTLSLQTSDGCEVSLTREDYIEVFPTLIPEIDYDVIGECAPFIVSFQSNLQDDFNLLWNFGNNNISNAFEPLEIFDDTGTFTVSLEIDDDAICSVVATREILLQGNPPTFSFDAPESICANQSDSIQAIFEDGTIYWHGGGSEPSHEITEPGMYSATYTRSDGCETIDSVFVPEKFPPTIRTVNREACIGDAIQLFAESDAEDVIWKDFSSSNVAMVYEAGTYVAVATNECGSSETTSEVVLNDCSCDVFVPNSFTPNEDGINDLFKPSITCELNYYELKIFDRWGSLVFSSNDPQEGWNGNSEGNSAFYVQNGIYNYILRYDNALHPEFDRQERKGFVQILR